MTMKLAAVLLAAALGCVGDHAHHHDHQRWARRAEDAAEQRVLELAKTCPGGYAQGWAEINSEMPDGYEIIGECTQPG